MSASIPCLCTKRKRWVFLAFYHHSTAVTSFSNPWILFFFWSCERLLWWKLVLQHSRLVLVSRPVSGLLLKGLSLSSELTALLHGLVSAWDREDSRFYERVKTRAVSQINYFHLYARMQDTSVQLTYCVVHSFLTWVVLSPKLCTALLLLLEVTTGFIFFFFFAFYFSL